MLARLFLLATALYLRLLGARRKRLRKGALTLVYYDVGPRDGEPWVLLHGLGSVAAGWSPVMRALRRSCRLLVPELSALGGTECPGGGLDMRQGVEILTELTEREFGRRPVTVAGLSLGGWMAARLALAHPERVSRLVLIDAGGYHDQDWGRIQSLVTIEDLAGVDRLYQALFVRVPWLMRVSRAAFLKAYTSPGVKLVLSRLSEADTFGDADLARLPMPAALIWGEGDGIFAVETARAMAAALPRPHLDVLPGCGHALHLECPRALIRALQRFRRATSAEESPQRHALPASAAGRRV
ncbi:MAG TPA: alpha/beta hydrolase [Thermoanaerobaculia bacterium]|jgi:pimeloyl-ACP methyl ester carboxylesterase